MTSRTQKSAPSTRRSWLHIGFVILAVAVIGLAATVVVLLLRPATVVSNFDQCKQAGGALLESYPEQCMISGTSFTNTAASAGGSSPYIGLSEEAALAKASQERTPARVVERDGTALPATMDFAFGRHNLYVKNGTVYKVEIEGQASDSPLEK